MLLFKNIFYLKMFITIFFSIIMINICNSQTNDKLNFCDSSENKLLMRFESTSFVKNNEYFNKFAKGFTGIGFFMKPSLEYYFTETTKINIGTYFLKYYGTDNFNQIFPIFTIHQKLGKNFNLIMGSLYSSLFHEIEEPCYRSDRYYQNNSEFGIQLIWLSKNIKSDLWIDWEKFIQKGDPFQEKIFAGSTTELKFFQKTKYSLIIPLQVFAHHSGGQIDSTDLPVVTTFNFVSGINIKFDIFNNKSIKLENLFFYYKNSGKPTNFPAKEIVNQGIAFYTKLKYQAKNQDLTLGFWNANKFFAPHGEYLFMSISEFDNTFYENNRKLLTLKYEISYSFCKKIDLEFATSLYYDLINNNLDYSMNLYFNINKSFELCKIKSI